MSTTEGVRLWWRGVLAAALVVLFERGPLLAQEYAWPLEGARSISSTFGGYRPEHLHAGVDLTTGREIGRRVHAADGGYVWRVRTSPWGYGAAVYLRLRDGNTAVYAHLSGFVPKIARRVEERQEEMGRYSVDVYPREGEIPVARGEVIGQSGDTGAGPAHLHFELRDQSNRPINPLGQGLTVPDTKPPRITRIAVMPVGPGSWVNGGHQPVILKMDWDRPSGMYVTDETPCASGAIRVAAEIFDRGDRAPNPLSPYRVELYADEVRVFVKQLDMFPYEDTHHVELDRVFSLRASGRNGFHSLYRAPGNRLPLYGDQEPGEGTLLYGGGPAGSGRQLLKGRHTLRVVARDFRGNEAEAQLGLLMDAAPQLSNWGVEETSGEDTRGVEVCGSVRDADDATLRLDVWRSLDGGASWEAAGTESVGTQSPQFRLLVGGAEARNGLYRVRATDSLGVSCWGGTCLVAGGQGDGVAPSFRATKVVHPDFLEVQWETTKHLARPPSVEVWREGRLHARPTARQTDLRRYAACVDFEQERDGPRTVVLAGVDGWGQWGETELVYEQKTITGAGRGRVESADGWASAEFPAGAVYAPLWPSIASFEPEAPEALRPVGAGYDFLPSTVPFDKPVTVAVRVPEAYPRPEQLGIYRRLQDGTWELVDNTVDAWGHTVEAQVRYFSAFALLADETPPTISLIIPEPGALLTEDRPLLRASVRDLESGIRREEDVVVRLDGRRQISVYDPEAHTVSCQVKQPLAEGEHVLEFVVRDACGNEATRRSTFSIH